MKKNLMTKEKNKLPLTFKYIDVVKNKSREIKHFSTTITCEKYQTNNHVKLKPYKFLTRLI